MKRLAAALLASTALALQPAYGQQTADSATAAIGTSGCGIYAFGGVNGFGCFDGSSAKPKAVPIAPVQIPFGTTAGTAAAGNDSRITGAAQQDGSTPFSGMPSVTPNTAASTPGTINKLCLYGTTCGFGFGISPSSMDLVVPANSYFTYYFGTSIAAKFGLQTIFPQVTNVGAATGVSSTDPIESVIPYSISGGQLRSVSTRGAQGGAFGSRCSDNTSAGAQGCTGVNGYVLNNNTAYVQTAYASYMEARRSAGAGTTEGYENMVSNGGNSFPATQYTVTPSGYTIGNKTECGRGDIVSNPCSIGYFVSHDAAQWYDGIWFAKDAILGVNPDGTLNTGSSTTTTAASTTNVVALTSATYAVGGSIQTVTGTGVPSGTTVTSVTGLNATLSQAVSVASGATLTFGAVPWGHAMLLGPNERLHWKASSGDDVFINSTVGVPSTPGGTVPAAGASQSLTFTQTGLLYGFANVSVGFSGNLSGVLPTYPTGSNQGGVAIGYNYQSGQGETDLFNIYSVNALGTQFAFYDRTGTYKMLQLAGAGDTVPVPFQTTKGERHAISSATASFNFDTTMQMKVVDASSGAVNGNLPACATATDGQDYTLTKADASTNAVAFNPNGTDKINGSNAVTVIGTAQAATMTVRCNAIGTGVTAGWWKR